MKFSQIRLWTAVSFLTVLAACGGGGGGSSGPVASRETFQLRTAYFNEINSYGSWPFSISGFTSSGTNYAGSGTLTEEQISSAVFEGQTVQAKAGTATYTASANGQNIPYANTYTSYFSSEYAPLGRRGGEYEVVNSSVLPPVTAKVSDSGWLFSSTRYPSSSKTYRLGSASVSYVLEADTASTALLKIIRIEKDTSNTTTATIISTYRVTPSGEITRISQSNTENSGSVTISYGSGSVRQSNQTSSGSGSSASPTSSTEIFQLRAGYASYLASAGTKPFTLAGTASGISISGSGTSSAGNLSSTTFEGQSAQAQTTTTTGTLTANGQSTPLTATSTTYVDGNYNPLGFDGSQYEVVTSSISIPTTARVNDSAVWYQSTRYTDSSKTTVLGTTTASFVLEAETAFTALLKIIEVERNTSNTVTSTNTITFRMTPAGVLTRLSETLVEGTTSLTVTY